MTEKPILFSGPMVRAIPSGAKTQTRRIFRRECDRLAPSPYSAGMFLWVRETWAVHPDGDGIIYRATDPGWDDNDAGIKWRPSIFMPRWASRITLEVTAVRVQRVQEITEEDAVEEGAVAWWNKLDPAKQMELYRGGRGPCAAFHALWDSINAKRGYSWDVNPWVRATTFRMVKP